MNTQENIQKKKDEIIIILAQYLQESKEDYQDRWITEEKLFRLMKELKDLES